MNNTIAADNNDYMVASVPKGHYTDNRLKVYYRPSINFFHSFYSLLYFNHFFLFLHAFTLALSSFYTQLMSSTDYYYTYKYLSTTFQYLYNNYVVRILFYSLVFFNLFATFLFQILFYLLFLCCILLLNKIFKWNFQSNYYSKGQLLIFIIVFPSINVVLFKKILLIIICLKCRI